MMKKNYKEMTKPERQAEYAAVKAEFEGAKALHLELNMARGKPSRQQLDMVTPMLQVLTQPEQFVSDGVETRNYGEVAGIPAARKLFADILGCKVEDVYEELEKLLNNLIQKKALHEYGMSREQIEEFADSVIANQGRLMANNFVELDRDRLIKIYTELY